MVGSYIDSGTDVNSDGAIDATDALQVLYIAAKLKTPTAAETQAADVTHDEIVDATDALQILKYAAQLITSFD